MVIGTFIFDLFLPVNELIKESDGEDFSEAAKTKFEIKLFASKNFIMHSTLSPFMINFLGFFSVNDITKFSFPQGNSQEP